MTISSYRLGITCCFCGGSLEVDEASHTARCGHCGSVLRVAREGGIRGYYIDDDTPKREVKFLIDRHLKDSGDPLVSSWGDISRVYLPFWRISAITFSAVDKSKVTVFEYGDSQREPAEESQGVQVKIVTKDVTFCGNDRFAWGIESLGIRTQVLRLDPLCSEFYESNHPVKLTTDFEQAKDRFIKTVESTATAVSTTGSRVNVSAISPEGMLIYFPIWLAEVTSRSGGYVVQYDPVAKRVVSMAQSEFEIPLSESAPSYGCDSIRITPHRCPNCGCDLPECKESVAYYCGNCGRLFTHRGLEYKQLELRIPSDINQGCRLFPFWVFDLANSVGPEKENLLKALNLIGFSRDRFYVPAFNITNPSRLLRLVSHYNRIRDELTFEGRSSRNCAFADVTLAAEAAASLISPLTAATKAIKGYGSYETPAEGLVGMSDPELVWPPHALDRYFWREQITGAAIEKAAVRV